MTDELKAGPELDARIATEVMGWYALPIADTNGVPCWSNRPSASAFAEKTDWFRPAETWRPSTDIADAWRILEWLQPPARNDAWREFIHSWVGALHLSHMTAREAAFAICRAALQDRENGDA